MDSVYLTGCLENKTWARDQLLFSGTTGRIWYGVVGDSACFGKLAGCYEMSEEGVEKMDYDSVAITQQD